MSWIFAERTRSNPSLQQRVQVVSDYGAAVAAQQYRIAVAQKVATTLSPNCGDRMSNGES